MAIDSPNPAGDEHEHLFHAADVEYAARLRQELITAIKVFVRPCEICRAPIDLMTGRRPSDPALRGG